MAYKILKKEEIAPSIHKMVIEAPDVAKAAKAGQFIIPVSYTHLSHLCS